MPKNLALLLFLGASAACAQSITISNPSFENATLPISSPTGMFSNILPGSTLYPPNGMLADWTATSTTTQAAAGAGTGPLGPDSFTSHWGSGSNIGFVQVAAVGAAGLSQTLSANLLANTTYTLTVKVGNPGIQSLNGIPIRFNYALELWAGTTKLASVSNLALSPNSSGTDTLSYFSGTANPLNGMPLTIALITAGSNGAITEAFFDDVSLTASTGQGFANNGIIAASASAQIADYDYSPFAQPYNLPTRLSECEGNLCGGVWTLQDFHGTAQWPNAAFSILIVDRLDFDGIVIKRVDSAGSTPGLSAVYKGKIVGNLIEGDVTWSWRTTNTGKWSAIILDPANYKLINPSLPCSPLFKGSGAEAAERGGAALEATQYKAALCWFRLGASTGNADAEGYLASMLFLGLAGSRDYAEAFKWAKNAADQANYFGERTLFRIYETGQGAAKDPKLAEYWNTKALQAKAALILAEQREQQARERIYAQQVSVAQQAQQSRNAAAAFWLFLFGAMTLDSGSGGAVLHDDPLYRQDALRAACASGFRNPAACN